MQRYEFRILDANNRTESVVSAIQINDFAAIRRAQSLLGPGQGVEVWRDMACIFARNQRIVRPAYMLHP